MVVVVPGAGLKKQAAAGRGPRRGGEGWGEGGLWMALSQCKAKGTDGKI